MISVIIPAYNAANYIRQALESVQAQTYRDFEIIVIDDGSSDNTKEIALQAAPIRYHYQENRGEATARNKGMSLAKGDFFAFLDADDWYEPSKLEQQYHYLMAHPEQDIVYCDFVTLDEISGKRSILRAEQYHPQREDFLATILFRQILPNVACTLFRRHCYDSGCRFKPELRYAPDYDFSLQLLQKFTIGYIPEALYGYRRHSSNMTNAHDRQRASEVQIVKNLGQGTISDIVAKSSFSDRQKRVLLAKIMLKIAEYSEVIALLEPVLSESPDPLLYLYVGNAYFLLGDPEKSMHFFSKAIERDEGFAEGLNNLGCACFRTGKIEEAFSLFRKALILRPGYMDPEHNIKDVNSLRLTTFELRNMITTYY